MLYKFSIVTTQLNLSICAVSYSRRTVVWSKYVVISLSETVTIQTSIVAAACIVIYISVYWLTIVFIKRKHLNYGKYLIMITLKLFKTF
jgi:uncharacterized membrane-anchored protein